MAAKKPKASKPAPPRVSPGADKLHTAQVRQLIDLMVANDLTSLEIVNGDLKVSLGRGHAGGPATGPLAGMPPVAPPAPLWPPAPAPKPEPAEAGEGLLEIKSPMVGTFYAAPSPDSEPFVTVGAHGGRRDGRLHRRGHEGHERDQGRVLRHHRRGLASRTASRWSTARCSSAFRPA